jgi:formylglycine-generating enzyme required for sulfatase activity
MLKDIRNAALGALAVLALAATAPAQSCAGDLNGDGTVNGIDLGVLLGNWGTCPPSITQVSPLTGSVLGGTVLSITGSGLSEVTAVTVGGAPCTELTVVSPTLVRATTPAGVAGEAAIRVIAPSGSTFSPAPFIYHSIVVPSWATLVEAQPDPGVVTAPALRAAIAATGLAWRVRDTATQVEMLLVPPGTFQMGCIMWSDLYGCPSREGPVHQVTLTSAFYLGRYEVTQAQWVARMGSNPSRFHSASAQVPASNVPERPVEQVTWNAIQGYLRATGFRLPTEAEWEFACRAGTQTPFYNGSTDDSTVGTLAWYSPNSSGQTRPVGRKAANAFGFHDMLGNVHEWVNDWYGDYTSDAQTNPTGSRESSWHVIRGGSWILFSDSVKASSRDGCTPGFTSSDIGFRVARNP